MARTLATPLPWSRAKARVATHTTQSFNSLETLYLHHPNVEKFVCLLEIELETIHETGPKILEFGKKMPEVEPEYFEI